MSEDVKKNSRMPGKKIIEVETAGGKFFNMEKCRENFQNVSKRWKKIMET